jgi:DNA mismatch repair protein MSH6
MRREVCSLTTPGTRLYTVLDMRLEKEGGGFEPVSGPTHLAAVCEQGSTVGVCVCDSPTGTFTLAQFEDDVQRTRLRTLLAALPPAEVLIPRGSRDLAEICERATGASVELLTPTSEFLDADSCIEYLSICGAFPKASKQGNDNDVSARWPPVLRTAVRGRADSALSAMGAVAWWLRRALVDVELLSMRRVDAYVPPDLGEAPESTSEFVPHDEAQLLEAALAISSTDDDDDWRASLRRKAPRMALDATTLKNLEVLKSSAPDGWSGSLWHLTHHCRTAFGGRLLRDWLSRPLLEKRDIDARADAVQELVESPDLYEGLAKALKQKGIGDLERALQQLHTLGADRRAPSADGTQHPDARAILFDKLKFDARRVKQLCSAISGLERCASIMSSLTTKEPTSQLLKRLAPGSPSKRGGGCFPSLDEKLRPFRQFNLDHAAKEGVLQSSRGADPAVDQAQDAVKAREKALDDWLKEAQREHGCSLKWKHSAKDRYCVEAADVLFGRGGKLERLPAGWQQRSKTKKARSFAVPALKSLIQALEDAESSEKDLKADQMRRAFSE